MGMEMKKDLMDVTFNVPLKVESIDRQEVVTILIDYLLHHFETNIIVYEVGSRSLFSKFMKSEWKGKLTYEYEKVDDDEPFHKTKMLNNMARMSLTPIITSMDTDVLFNVNSYIEAKNMILNGNYDFVYPFDRPTVNVAKAQQNQIASSMSLKGIRGKITNLGIAPGGCFFMDQEKFFEYGMENEVFRGYAPEDRERLLRFGKLGGKIGKVKGHLYHLDHFLKNRDNLSRIDNNNPYTEINEAEYDKIFHMTNQELYSYIRSEEYNKNV